MKILIIVTSTGTFANGKLATGLWLSEFTHIYHSAKESGYDITVANPKGGYIPILSKDTVGKPCPVCGEDIRKENFLGGSIYYCFECQK